jgi:hypothetical protein
MPARDDRRLLQTQIVQNPDRTIEVYEGAPVNELSADGFGRSWSGPQLTKIELIRVTDVTDNAVEVREVFARLSVPTPALIEFCFNLINGLGTNLPLMEQQAEALRKMITDGVARTSTLKL